MEWGHVLSKLALSDRQMEAVDTRPPPSEREVLERRLAEGDLRAQESLYALTADPDLQTWDPAAAAGHLLAILARGTPADDAFVLQRFRTAPPEVRAGVEAQVDIVGLYERAATGGDPRAALDLGLLLQTRAGSAAQLTVARTWLERAATGGEIAAMTELGRMLALGLGGPPDRGLALAWLDQAARAGDPDAAELARLLRAAE
jgi:TPR repeat protein